MSAAPAPKLRGDVPQITLVTLVTLSVPAVRKPLDG
jgi:hypothetical protein